jgi:uncharacterized protein (TIGR02301 family)
VSDLAIDPVLGKEPGKLSKHIGRLLIALAMAVSVALPAGPGRAQEPPPPQQQLEPEFVEPPYEAQFLRLSEILGAIHYLRRLCDSDEGGLWRNQMQALIDAEAPNPIRRARIVDRFNHGYESFRSVYRTCTPAATVAIDRYLAEGAKIARDVTARYGK